MHQHPSHDSGRHQQNLQTHPQRPVLDLPEIVLDAQRHLLRRVGLPAEAVDPDPAEVAQPVMPGKQKSRHFHLEFQ
jgi:hypothetical protein